TRRLGGPGGPDLRARRQAGVTVRRTLYDSDHEAFRDVMRSFVDRTLRPGMERHAREHRRDRDCWLRAGRAGILGLEVPEEYGGAGARDYRFNAVFNEELAKFAA